MSAPVEKWRPVVGYEGAYEVSDLGRVRSVDRLIVRRHRDGVRSYRLRGRLLRPTTATGYAYVNLGLNNSRRVSALVAEAFIGPRPFGLYVLHSDGDSRNDHVRNLRYGTQEENMADAVAHGTIARGAKVSRRLDASEIELIRGLHGLMTGSQIAAEFGVSRGAVVNIQARRSRRKVGAITPERAAVWLHDFGPGGRVRAQIEWDRREMIWGPSKLEDQKLAQEAWAA